MFCLPAKQIPIFFRLQLMNYIEGWRKFHTEFVCFFITFLVTKKKLLRALLTCIFICLLLNSFDLRSYSSKSRRRYTFRLLCVMLLMCLEVLREGFLCFPVGDWEGVCKELLSLVFLSFQLLAKMLNFIFIEVTRIVGYLRWLYFVQENWLRGHTFNVCIEND